MTRPRRKRRAKGPPAVVHLKSAGSWRLAACGEERRLGHVVIGAARTDPHVARGPVCPACLEGRRPPKGGTEVPT